MPDVIIKGMEMPRNCDKCRLSDVNYFCLAARERTGWRTGGRPHMCPLRPAPEWISVEAPPSIGERVILRAGVFVGEGYYTSAHTWWRSIGVPVRDLTDQPVTHWMPLPSTEGLNEA